MYTRLAQNVYVTNSEQFSQAVSMEGANSVAFNVTVMEITSGTLTVSVQASNDLENWNTLASTDKTFTAAGYGKKRITGIAETYVRLVYSMGVSGSAIVSAGINTAEL